MNASTLLDSFTAPLLLGGTPRIDLPLSDDAFEALVAEPPPAAPGIAAALTRASRVIWASSPPATVDADVLYTSAMLHDLLGALHPLFVESTVAGWLGRRVERRLAARFRRLERPLDALRRHVIATAALRSYRQDEHVDLKGLGRVTTRGGAVELAELPWRVEVARTQSAVSAVETLTGPRLSILNDLSPLTGFVLAAQAGTALPWVRWLTAAPPLLRFVVHTLSEARTGPDALMATLMQLDGRRPADARWWLGLCLLIAERNPDGPDDFRLLVDVLRPFGRRLGAPAARPRRRDHAPCAITRLALSAARLET